MPKARVRTRLTAEVRRGQILAEALRMIGRRGFNGLVIQELAEKCGLTNAGLLHYFGSKNQLLIELLQDVERRDADVVVAAAGLGERGPKRRVTRDVALKLLRAIIAQNVEQPEIVRLYAVLRVESIEPGAPGAGVLPQAGCRHAGGVRPYVGAVCETAAIDGASGDGAHTGVGGAVA